MSPKYFCHDFWRVLCKKSKNSILDPTMINLIKTSIVIIPRYKSHRVVFRCLIRKLFDELAAKVNIYQLL